MGDFLARTKAYLRKRPIVSSILISARDHKFRRSIAGIELICRARPYLVSACVLGLSNRLKCLLSSMRIVDALSKSIVLYWPRNWACRCDFSDLFDNNIFEVDSEAFEVLRERARRGSGDIILDTWRLLPLKGDLPAGFRRTYDQPTTASIDFEYANVPVTVRRAYDRHVQKLKPARYVRTEVERYSRSFSSDTVSVSIRSWPEAKERAEAFFSLSNVYTALDALGNRPLFVSCDSEELLVSLKDRYGRRVMHYPKRTAVNDRTSREGMQDILIDLLLLSRNKHLVASYLSTFPELAWWLGGCQATVSIIETKSAIQSWLAHFQGDETTVVPAGALEVPSAS